MAEILALEDVHVYYGESYVLQGVSLSVDEGEMVVMLGRNGAGKTTTVSAVVGFVSPRRGRVQVAGREVAGWPPYRIARLGVGLVPQGRRLFSGLTVEHNVRLGMEGRDGRWGLERVLEAFPVLQERWRVPAGRLSGGEQQMVAIARALATSPRLLIMDEPSEGLAPLMVRRVAEVLRGLKAEGQSLFLVEQNLALARAVADRLYVMNKGRIVFSGTAEELEAAEEVKHKYLGV